MSNDEKREVRKVSSPFISSTPEHIQSSPLSPYVCIGPERCSSLNSSLNDEKSSLDIFSSVEGSQSLSHGPYSDADNQSLHSSTDGGDECSNSEGESKTLTLTGRGETVDKELVVETNSDGENLKDSTKNVVFGRKRKRNDGYRSCPIPTCKSKPQKRLADHIRVCHPKISPNKRKALCRRARRVPKTFKGSKEA